MKTIALHDLTVLFGDVRALNQISLTLNKCEVLLLAGPNGAGKSTLIKVILGLIKPTKGFLSLNGKKTHVTNAVKQCIGYLPEAVSFAEGLTGRQIMRFFAMARGIQSRRIYEVLEQVSLLKAANRAVRGYSKGMRQRLGLGVAILSDPDLLILDEPTGGLDQEGLSVLWDIMAQAREKHKTILISSHDLALFEKRVTRMGLMKEGVFLANKSPSELRLDAHLPLEIEFELHQTATDTHPFMVALRKWNYFKTLSSSGNHINIQIPPEELMNLMDLKAQFSSEFQRLRIIEPGLDVVYEALLEAI